MLASICALASPKCLVSEPDKDAFVSELLRELDSGLHKIPDLRAKILGVLDNNAWRDVSFSIAIFTRSEFLSPICSPS